MIRKKYELRPRLELISEPINEEPKTLRTSKSLSTLSEVKPAAFLRHRMKDNQRQKSFLSIAKWAICDAKKFEEKIKRLKGLIDGLEDISQAAGIVKKSPAAIPRPTSTSPDELPPPYTLERPASVRRSIRPASIRPLSIQIPATIAENVSPIATDLDLPSQYLALKQYLVGLSPTAYEHPRSRARNKLLALSERQMKDLRADIYDELIRRKPSSIDPLPFLPIDPSFHQKRNQARQKLATLATFRFGHLVMDTVFELERRFPYLEGQSVPGVVANEESEDPFSISRSPVFRRYGCFLPRNGPSPSHTTTRIANIQESIIELPDTTQRSESCDIFKSFQVQMDDPTYKVLPAALKKYNINAPWEKYALHIIYGAEERCLALDEKPLLLFKELEREGKKPMFMLRRRDSVRMSTLKSEV